jgi:steroid 5-alpha reductase family enzyme
VSRGLVGGVFALFSVANLAEAARHVEDAISVGTARPWLDAGYWLLKTGVVAAFFVAVLRRPEPLRPSREPVAFAACALAILGAVALRPGTETSTAWLMAGEVVALASCAFLLASVLTLGTCFGVLPEARGLVTRGPYRLVRHPVYLGEQLLRGSRISSSPSRHARLRKASPPNGRAGNLRRWGSRAP